MAKGKLGEKLRGFGKKHRAKEILIVGLSALAVAGLTLFLIIREFGLQISVGIGDIILAYVPHLLIIALGGILIGYPNPKSTWMGVGMLIVGVGLMVIDAGKMIYLA